MELSMENYSFHITGDSLNKYWCHDQFLPVGHWFKEGLRVDEAVSHGGCCGCAATRRRGEWTRECPTRGKVPRRVREVFSAGFGSEASELSFARKR